MATTPAKAQPKTPVKAAPKTTTPPVKSTDAKKVEAVTPAKAQPKTPVKAAPKTTTPPVKSTDANKVEAAKPTPVNPVAKETPKKVEAKASVKPVAKEAPKKVEAKAPVKPVAKEVPKVKPAEKKVEAKAPVKPVAKEVPKVKPTEKKVEAKTPVKPAAKEVAKPAPVKPTETKKVEAANPAPKTKPTPEDLKKQYEKFVASNDYKALASKFKAYAEKEDKDGNFFEFFKGLPFLFNSKLSQEEVKKVSKHTKIDLKAIEEISNIDSSAFSKFIDQAFSSGVSSGYKAIFKTHNPQGLNSFVKVIFNDVELTTNIIHLLDDKEKKSLICSDVGKDFKMLFNGKATEQTLTNLKSNDVKYWDPLFSIDGHKLSAWDENKKEFSIVKHFLVHLESFNLADTQEMSQIGKNSPSYAGDLADMNAVDCS